MSDPMHENVDQKTVAGFGDEWTRFDQSELSLEDATSIFESYFSIFPWHRLPREAVGFDVGCGSGRWANFVAERVGKLFCLDPSAAIEVAKKNLRRHANCEFYRASVDNIPVADGSMDFGYSLGVLHHVPDTRAALAACVSKLKPGAPFLIYLYYAFDNRPIWFKAVWQVSEGIRQVVSRLPHGLRYVVSQFLAVVVYFPLARVAKVLERINVNVSKFPLSAYRDKGFYVMRTDALDRFGTRLEHRFTRNEISDLMESVGLEHIVFREQEPFWCALGYAKGQS
jgi:SAM-dependent methyltransferase